MWKSSFEWFKLKACKMFMHRNSMNCIMVKKMFTFRVESSSGSKTVVIWRFILLHNITNNVWTIQSYLLLQFFQFKKIGPMQMQISFEYKIVWKFIHVLPMMQYPCMTLDWHVVGPLQNLVWAHYHVDLF